MSETGRKFDGGKARFDLIPGYPLWELAQLYRMGAEKYSDRNWENGIAFSRLFAALQRHAWAFWNGEDRDPEDGQLHLSSVAWCAFAMTELAKTMPEFDDRPGPGLKSEPAAVDDSAKAIGADLVMVGRRAVRLFASRLKLN